MIRHLEEFFRHHAAAGSTKATISFYRQQLGTFTAWATRQGYDVDDHEPWLNRANITQFLADERARGLADLTVNARYRALSAFLGWAYGPELKLFGEFPYPLEGVERPRIHKKAPRRTMHDEFETIVNSIMPNRWVDLRDVALLHTMFWGAARVGEVKRLRTDDMNVSQRLVVFRGKTGERIATLPHDTVTCIVSYIMNRPPWPGPELWIKDDGAGKPNGVLSAEGIRQMLRRRCIRAGVEIKNPHSFRHGFSVSMLNAGMDMSAVSKHLGHSSVQITEKFYAEWETEGLRGEYDRAYDRLNDGTQKALAKTSSKGFSTP